MDNKFADIDILLNGIFEESLRHLFEKRVYELGTSQTAVEKSLNIAHRTLDGILDGTQRTVNIIAYKNLAAFLNMSPEKLMEKHIALYEKTHAKINYTSGNKKKFIREHFDLTVLKKAGFIKDLTDFDAIEKRITTYLGYKDIFEYKRHTADVAFMAGVITPKKTETREFWLESARIFAEKLDNRYYYDRQELIKYFPQIRWHTTNVEYGLINVIKSLFKLGITVIFQTSLSTLHLRGATFSVDEQPCIVLTDYKGFYATLWHCLIHELYHVLFDFEDIKNNTYGYHVTEDFSEVLNIDPNEVEADDFAREYLFAKKKISEAYPFIMDAEYIKEVARLNNVHPSIIYTYYAYDNGSMYPKSWARLKKHDEYITPKALKRLQVSWEDIESIDSTANKLKLSIYN